jgi:hypothetical protein
MKKVLLSMILLLSVLSGSANAAYYVGGITPLGNEDRVLSFIFPEDFRTQTGHINNTMPCREMINYQIFGLFYGLDFRAYPNGDKCFQAQRISVYATNEVYNRSETYNKSEVYNKAEIDTLILNQSKAFELAGGAERLRASYKLTDSIIEERAQMYVDIKMRNEVKKQIGQYLKKAPEADDMIYVKRSELAKIIEEEVAKKMKSLYDDK